MLNPNPKFEIRSDRQVLTTCGWQADWKSLFASLILDSCSRVVAATTRPGWLCVMSNRPITYNPIDGFPLTRCEHGWLNHCQLRLWGKTAESGKRHRMKTGAVLASHWQVATQHAIRRFHIMPRPETKRVLTSRFSVPDSDQARTILGLYSKNPWALVPRV